MLKTIYKYGWWGRQSLLLLLSIFFFYWGVTILISAYRLTDPFSFIMTFFSSNFIILISGALMVVFIARMISVYKKLKEKTDGQAGEE